MFTDILNKIKSFYLSCQIDGHTAPQGHSKNQIQSYVESADLHDWGLTFAQELKDNPIVVPSGWYSDREYAAEFSKRMAESISNHRKNGYFYRPHNDDSILWRKD